MYSFWTWNCSTLFVGSSIVKVIIPLQFVRPCQFGSCKQTKTGGTNSSIKHINLRKIKIAFHWNQPKAHKHSQWSLAATTTRTTKIEKWTDKRNGKVLIADVQMRMANLSKTFFYLFSSWERGKVLPIRFRVCVWRCTAVTTNQSRQMWMMMMLLLLVVVKLINQKV